MKFLPNDKMIDKTQNVNSRGCDEPISGSLPPGQDSEKGVCNIKPPSQPVVTIDDLETLSNKLLAEIRIFKSYKYPMAVRRGVKPK